MAQVITPTMQLALNEPYTVLARELGPRGEDCIRTMRDANNGIVVAVMLGQLSEYAAMKGKWGGAVKVAAGQIVAILTRGY